MVVKITYIITAVKINVIQIAVNAGRRARKGIKARSASKAQKVIRDVQALWARRVQKEIWAVLGQREIQVIQALWAPREHQGFRAQEGHEEIPAR